MSAILMFIWSLVAFMLTHAELGLFVLWAIAIPALLVMRISGYLRGVDRVAWGQLSLPRPLFGNRWFYGYSTVISLLLLSTTALLSSWQAGAIPESVVFEDSNRVLVDRASLVHWEDSFVIITWLILMALGYTFIRGHYRRAASGPRRSFYRSAFWVCVAAVSLLIPISYFTVFRTASRAAPALATTLDLL